MVLRMEGQVAMCPYTTRERRSERRMEYGYGAEGRMMPTAPWISMTVW